MTNFEYSNIRRLAKENIDNFYKNSDSALYATSDGCGFVLYEFAIQHEIDLLIGAK